MDASESDLITLQEELGTYAYRPRAFVYACFPWGVAGTELENRKGPEAWQDAALGEIERRLIEGLHRPGQIIAEAIQIAIRSGHDIGKSAFVCWLILWAVSTREDTKGVVTANTEKQLRLKLWSELAKWHRLFIGQELFRVTATAIQAAEPKREKEWKVDAIPWSEDNTEAFQGLHNLGKRVLVIFDEASGIVDKIWETVDGVMNEAETELIWIATGNPTRNTGRFRECFREDGQGQFWWTLRVDSREVSFTNKDRIERAIALWGVDSDYIKVRWLGEFPESANAQLIPSDDIRRAMICDQVAGYSESLILGVDIARMGDNETVLVFRRGKDARGIPAQRIRKMDSVSVADAVANAIAKYSPDAVFIDEGNTGGAVIDFLRRLGHAVVGVNFGATAATPLGGEKAWNKRAEMYLSLRTWLREGGAIENSSDLERQLLSVEYGFTKRGKLGDAILLSPKEDMDESPDIADALALTFAYPVHARAWRGRAQIKVDYDPLSPEALPSQDAPLWNAPRTNHYGSFH